MIETPQPRQQPAAAGWGGRELPVGELAPDLVDHRWVMGLAMGVHTAGHRARVVDPSLGPGHRPGLGPGSSNEHPAVRQWSWRRLLTVPARWAVCGPWNGVMTPS
jgi:hypothetical protein